MPDLRLHNEGQIVPLVTAEGDATGYSVELARLTYQNTRVAVLKLGILDAETERPWPIPGPIPARAESASISAGCKLA